MNYGIRALQLLKEYYEFKMTNLNEDLHKESSQSNTSATEEMDIDIENEKIEPKSILPPLLMRLTERQPEVLHYLGVSFDLTLELLIFWKQAKFVPLYLNKTPNEITGEHSCIMLLALNKNSDWLITFWKEFRMRFMRLLSSAFR